MPIDVPFRLATAATAPAATPGFGSSLSGLGTATKVFVLAHPVGLAIVGGAVLGAGLYHLLARKPGAPVAAEADLAPAAEPAAA